MKKISGKNMTWQPKKKSKKNQSYQISCIFLTQISNSSQFRHGEVWWKFRPKSQNIITLSNSTKKVFVNKLTKTKHLLSWY